VLVSAQRGRDARQAIGEMQRVGRRGRQGCISVIGGLLEGGFRLLMIGIVGRRRVLGCADEDGHQSEQKNAAEMFVDYR